VKTSRSALIATLLAVSLLPAGTAVAAPSQHSRPYARNAQSDQGRSGLGHAYGPVEVGPQLSADRGPSAS